VSFKTEFILVDADVAVWCEYTCAVSFYSSCLRYSSYYCLCFCVLRSILAFIWSKLFEIKIPRPCEPASGLQMKSTGGIFSASCSVISPEASFALRFANFLALYEEISCKSCG